MADYCGIDIVEVQRIKQAILDTPGFKEKIFTQREIEEGDAKIDIVKYQYYAGRFAAKEATYKALSKVYGDKIWLASTEILNDKTCNNRPYINIMHEELKQLLKSGKLSIDVSISHVKEYAVANVVARFIE